MRSLTLLGRSASTVRGDHTERHACRLISPRCDAPEPALSDAFVSLARSRGPDRSCGMRGAVHHSRWVRIVLQLALKRAVDAGDSCGFVISRRPNADQTAVSGSVRGSVQGSSVECFALHRKVFGVGALGRIRTCDTRFRKPVLYPLSYEGPSERSPLWRLGFARSEIQLLRRSNSIWSASGPILFDSVRFPTPETPATSSSPTRACLCSREPIPTQRKRHNSSVPG